jgi:RNA polymerase sigma-70 factor, ECF subfamily
VTAAHNDPATDGQATDELATVAAAAAAGDRRAQAALIRATRTEVWRLAAGLVDRDSADDLTQETYLRVLRALPAYQGRSTVRTWLLAIARRTCADHLRATVRRRRLGQRLPATETAQPDHTGLLDAVDLLRRLPPTRRAAFVLTQVLGLSYQEAADVEGVPVGTIRSQVARARADLVAAMGAATMGTAAPNCS